MFLLPRSLEPEPDFDGEAFYESVATLLKEQYGEHDVESFDWQIVQMGEKGVPCYEAAADIAAYIDEQRTCNCCGFDNRFGTHGALRSGSWNEPAHHCYGEQRLIRR